MSDNGIEHNTNQPGTGTQDAQIISIEDVNPDQKYDVPFRALLNSPRTLEAMRRQGMNGDELEPVTEEMVRKRIAERERGKRAIPQVLVDIRYKHYQERRKELFRLIKEERDAIIDEAERGSKFINGNRSMSPPNSGILFQVPMSEEDFKSPYLQKLSTRNPGKKKQQQGVNEQPPSISVFSASKQTSSISHMHSNVQRNQEADHQSMLLFLPGDLKVPQQSNSPVASVLDASRHSQSVSVHHHGQTDRGKPSKFISTASTVLNASHHGAAISMTPTVALMSKSVISSGSGGNGGQSSMIEKEKRALEKIKARQRKDIEQMMEYEMQMERIRQINEEKLAKQREKEARRQQELERAHAEQEERKRRDEERKREKAEMELYEQKKRADEQYRKEQEQLAKQREIELMRKREAQLREEDRKRKQEEFQIQTEKILHEQQLEVERRKLEMEKRDMERREFQARVQVERQRAATQKRMKAEAKIESAKSAADQALYRQRQEFEQRERKVEEKRRQFEAAREQERIVMQQRSHAKSVEMEKVKIQNQTNAEQRKQMILKAQELVEKRQQELAIEKERSLERKRQMLMEKEAHSVVVRQQMEKINQARIESIKSSAEKKEELMKMSQTQREFHLMIKREEESLRREEKWENVERIARAQEYKKKLILDKIEYDNSKTVSLKLEKDRLFSSRAQIRRDADRQKQLIVETFEKMRKRGRLDRSALIQFGVAIPEPIKEVDGEQHYTQEGNGDRHVNRRGSAADSQMNPISDQN